MSGCRWCLRDGILMLARLGVLSLEQRRGELKLSCSEVPYHTETILHVLLRQCSYCVKFRLGHKRTQKGRRVGQAWYMDIALDYHRNPPLNAAWQAIRFSNCSWDSDTFMIVLSEKNPTLQSVEMKVVVRSWKPNSKCRRALATFTMNLVGQNLIYDQSHAFQMT